MEDRYTFTSQDRIKFFQILKSITGKSIMSFIGGSGNCWEWKGVINKGGYGELRILAHRLFDTLWNGEIPSKLVVDHKCKVRQCVNPNHLESVTLKENTLRGNSPHSINKRKTHCKHGHEFTGSNLGIYIRSGKSIRVCKKCASINSKNYNIKHR